MKVVFDAQSIVHTPTGVGRYTLNLLLALSHLDHPPRIIPYYFNFRRKFQAPRAFHENPSIQPREIRSIPGFLMHRLWAHTNFWPLDRFTGDADIFHFPNYLKQPTRSGRVLITVHDLAFRRHPETLMPKNLRKLRSLFERSLRTAAAVLTISEFSKRELLEFYPSLQIPVHVTPIGIDPFPLESPAAPMHSLLKEKYGLPADYLLHVGSLEPRKNLIVLLKAFASIRSRVPGLHLVCVGPPGWLNAVFFQTLRELRLESAVILPGYIAPGDLPWVYRLARLLIFPSLYEGCGMPPLEAIACGTPVLVADIPTMREFLGDTVPRVSPTAPETVWAGQILDLVNDPGACRELVSRAEPLVRKLTWQQTAALTLQAYRQTLEGPD